MQLVSMSRRLVCYRCGGSASPRSCRIGRRNRWRSCAWRAIHDGAAAPGEQVVGEEAVVTQGDIELLCDTVTGYSRYAAAETMAGDT